MTVTVIESLGHERHLVCRLADGQLLIVRQASGDAEVEEASEVHISVDAQHLHVFDPQTEARISV